MYKCEIGQLFHASGCDRIVVLPEGIYKAGGNTINSVIWGGQGADIGLLSYPLGGIAQ